MCKRQWYDGVVKLKEFRDDRGILLPLNFDLFPFKVKHSFFVKGDETKPTLRGNHAHKKTEQVIICLSGEINVYKFNGIKETDCFITTGEAIYIPKLTWSHQTFFDNGSILVVCSEQYDENDYIRNYEEFLKL